MYACNRFSGADNMSSHFGEWLKHERKKRDLSQAKFGELVDLSKAQVSRLETGNQQTSLPTATRIAVSVGADAKEAIDALRRDASPLVADKPTEQVIVAGITYRVMNPHGEPVEHLVSEEDIDYLTFRAKRSQKSQ